MNRDDIIRMAREAGFEFKDRAEPKLERFFHAAYAAGAAAEREAIRQVVKQELLNTRALMSMPPQSSAAWNIHSAIRARSKE